MHGLMRNCIPAILLIGCIACTSVGQIENADEAADTVAAEKLNPDLPKGSKLETSGFISVDFAPPTEFPENPPPAQPRAEDLVEKFARENGYTIEKARGLINGTAEFQREIERLGTLLRNREAGNFVGMRMVRDPNVAMIVTFKRNAEETLRKYTQNPDFRPAEGGRTSAELQPVADRWIRRLEDNDLQFGLGIQPDRGQIEIGLGITRAEFEALVRQNGWTVEPEIIFSYAAPQISAFADPSLAALVRAFPRAAQAPQMVLSSLTTGTIILKDGCFRLAAGSSGAKGPLVLFGRDVQLTRDESGYLAIRTASKHLGRIGELMGWGGYGPANEKEKEVIALRETCGDDEIVSVGEAESMRLFATPYPAQIDEYARKRKMSRERAWREITSCLSENGDPRFSRGDVPLPEKDCYGMPTTPPPPVEDPADCPEGTTHSYGLCRDENGDSVPAIR